MKIAILEDDILMQEYLKDILMDNGYQADIYSTGESALEALKKNQYVMIISDINLPTISGYDVCETIKKTPDLYNNPLILMLSERSRQEDINNGFIYGADDYIKKPFDETELLMRINAILRRRKDTQEITGNKQLYNGLIIDFEQSYVIEDGIKIELSYREKELLRYLFINRGLILSKEKILNTVWQDDYDEENKIVEVYILKLKKKIGSLKELIKNYRNLGYKLLP